MPLAWITIVIEFVKELIKPLSVAIGSFLLFKQGKDSEKKKAAEEHVKDAKEAQDLNDHLNRLDDDSLDSILRSKRKPPTSK